MKVQLLQTPAQGVDFEQLARLHHNEFGGDRPFAELGVARAVRECVRDPNREWFNAWLGYDTAGHPVGYIVGTVRHNLYSFGNIASQEMWFVVPQHRSGLVAALLLWNFEQWAKQRECERIYMQVEHDDRPELVERIITIMDRFGYKKQGYIAVKHLNISNKDNDDDRTTHSGVGVEKAEQAAE